MFGAMTGTGKAIKEGIGSAGTGMVGIIKFPFSKFD